MHPRVDWRAFANGESMDDRGCGGGGGSGRRGALDFFVRWQDPGRLEVAGRRCAQRRLEGRGRLHPPQLRRGRSPERAGIRGLRARVRVEDLGRRQQRGEVSAAEDGAGMGRAGISAPGRCPAPQWQGCGHHRGLALRSGARGWRQVLEAARRVEFVADRRSWRGPGALAQWQVGHESRHLDRRLELVQESQQVRAGGGLRRARGRADPASGSWRRGVVPGDPDPGLMKFSGNFRITSCQRGRVW